MASSPYGQGRIANIVRQTGRLHQSADIVGVDACRQTLGQHMPDARPQRAPRSPLLSCALNGCERDRFLPKDALCVLRSRRRKAEEKSNGRSLYQRCASGSKSKLPWLSPKRRVDNSCCQFITADINRPYLCATSAKKITFNNAIKDKLPPKHKAVPHHSRNGLHARYTQQADLIATPKQTQERKTITTANML